MVEKTPRLGLHDYEPGDKNWDHSDLVNGFDERAVESGPIADRPTSGEYDDELYFAVDQSILWRWDSSISDWVGEGGKGSDSQPVPGTSHLEAVSTGSIDNVADTIVSSTSELESAFNNLSAGETIWIGQPDTPYRHSQWLDVDVSNVSIICQSAFAANGEALTKTADGANVGGIQVGRNAAVENVTIKGFGHDGNPTNQDSTVKRLHSIIFDDVTNATVADCFVTRQHPYREHNSGGSGISVGVNTTNISVHGNLVDDQGDRGIECAGTNCRIFDNTTVNGFDRGISLQHQGLDGGDWVCAQDTVVFGNYVADMSDGSCIKGRGLDGNSGTVEQSPENIIISNNVVKGTHRSGISYDDLTHAARKITISENICVNDTQDLPYYPGIDVEASVEGGFGSNMGLVISENYIEGYGEPETDAYGVRTDAVQGVTIRDNIVQEIDGTGIRVRGASENSIEGNTVRSCTVTGIEIESSGDSIISDNSVVVFDGVGNTGIRLNSLGGVHVHDNLVKQWEMHGIELVGANNCTVTGNAVTDGGTTTDNGIAVDSGSDNTAVLHNDLRDVSGTPLSDSATTTITDPVNQDTTEDYNLT